MISQSKNKTDKNDVKIGTIGDLVDPDLLQLLENSTRKDSEKKDTKKKIKIRIKKK